MSILRCSFEAVDATGAMHTIMVYDRPGGVCELRSENGIAVNTLSQGWYRIESIPPVAVYSDDPNCPKFPV